MVRTGQPRRVLWLTQFTALLHKNVLLLAASRGSPLKCLSGWGSLVLQLAVPALFFTIMLLPKYYIPPIPQPRHLQPDAWHLDEYRWSVDNPYSGPALSNQSQGVARILLTPDTPAVKSLLPVLARALACAPATYACPFGWQYNFHCLFTGFTEVAQHCQDQSKCMNDPSCYGHLLESPEEGQLPQLAIMRDEESAVKRALQRPAVIDAVVVFDRAHAGHTDGLGGMGSNQHSGGLGGGISAGGGRAPAHSLARSLREYRIRMNHTDMATPAFLLYDMFNVVPHRQYRKLFFFTNLQLALERSILGLRRWELVSGFPQRAPPPSSVHSLETSSSPVNESVPGGKHASSSSSSSRSDAWPADVRMSFKEFPWPAVNMDLGAASAGLMFILLTVFAFLSPTRAVVGTIVREKELGLREGMRIMGLADLGYWGSWFLTHWTTLFTSGILCAVIAVFPFNHTSFGVLILFFALFTSSLVCFSFFLSTLFSTSRIAGTVSQLLYTMSMSPGLLAPIISPSSSPPLYWACLFPPSAAALFAGCLIKWEVSSHGITWATVSLPATDYSSWSAASVLWMMALDVALYSLLAWYCDKVLPTSHSRTWHPLFFLNKAYWFPVDGHKKFDSKPTEDGRHLAVSVDGASRGADGLVAPDEGVSNFARGSVVAQKLRKEYRTTQGDIKVALDDVDIYFAGGRITALLGHNGAGKSTLFNILTGVMPPSSGNAYLNGYDVRTEMSRIRESLGVCPQHDVLWPELTVREHLQLYASIKGFKGQPLLEVVCAAGKQVGLDVKLDRQAGSLSGGEQRKLSVAIAFLGDPDIVLIDEPTSSMDPHTRRFTWELIRSYRGQATIVLTTHSMEEAELLADDVVIMAAGRVAAHGAPSELKSTHGSGYSLTLTLCNPYSPHLCTSTPADQLASASSEAKSQSILAFPSAAQGSGGGSPGTMEDRMKAVEALLKGYVPGAQLTRCKGSETCRALSSGAPIGSNTAEMLFQLPRAAAPLFPCLLRELDAAVKATELAAESSGMLQGSSSPGSASNKGNQDTGAFFGVSSYGLSVTTLEEVFFKVTETSREGSVLPQSKGASEREFLPQHLQQQPNPQPQQKGDEQHEQLPGHAGHLQGLALLKQQLRALLAKRALCTSRGRLTFLAQVLVPVLLVWLILMATWMSTVYVDEPAIPITRAMALKNRPAILSASPAVRGASDGRLEAWKLEYGHAYDSGCEGLYSGWRAKGTLDGWLLDYWYRGEIQQHADRTAFKTGDRSSSHGVPVPAYDALHIIALPSPQEWLVGNAPLQSSNSAAVNLTIMVNQTAIWGMPAAISSANTGLLRYLEGAARSSSGTASGLSDAADEPGFKVSNHPLPAIPNETTVRVGEDVTALLTVACLTLAVSVLSASFCVYLIRERASGSTHLQLLAGTPSWLYWACNLGWDLLLYSVPTIGILLLLRWYALPRLSGPRLPPIASLLAGFGVSSLPLTYLAQRFYTDEMEALQRINTIFFLLGFLGFMAVLVMELILIFAQVYFLESGLLEVVHDLLLTSFRLVSPHFCLAKGVSDVAQALWLPHYSMEESMDKSPWSFSAVGRPLAHMALQAVLYFGLVVFLDSGLAVRARDVVWHRLLTRMKLHSTAPETHPSGSGYGRQTHNASEVLQEEEDGDVRAEMLAVQQGVCDASGAVLVVDGASKAYGMGAMGMKAGCTRLMRCLLHSLRWLARCPRQRWGGGIAYAHVSDYTQGSGSSGESGAGTELSVGPSSSSHAWGSGGAEPAMDDTARLPATQQHGQAAERHGSGTDSCSALGSTESQDVVVVESTNQKTTTTESQDVVHALRGLWMHVMPGQCFGLLGVNGAGKSTAFKILTGETLPDEGDARIAGHSILRAPQQARKCLGYCPQTDAHSGDMTGREVLSMYARLRGVHESRVGPSVESLLQQMGFDVSSGGLKTCGALQVALQRGAAGVSKRATWLLQLARPHSGWQKGPARSHRTSSSGSDAGTEDACLVDEGDVEQAAGLLAGDAESRSEDCSVQVRVLQQRRPSPGCSVEGAGHVTGTRAGRARKHAQGSPGMDAASPAGVSGSKTQGVTDRGLTSADTRCGTYSGGSRRKLALAVALIGEPRLALLDEPSTGLDVGARRAMWSILQGPQVLKAGRGVVLTSHSMDECEALCDRLAIVSSGQARCIGSVQHLKNRFGGGYVLKARLLHPSGTRAASFEARVCQLEQQICSEHPGARVVENDGIRLEVMIPRGSGGLADLFETMEDAVQQCCVASYSISQCTLAHVFLHLAGKESGD